MPTKNPRTTVTLNEELIEVLETLSKKRKENISQIVRKFLKIGLLFS